MTESQFRLRIAAEDLSRRRPADQPERIARALRKASIDLNPHQVEAAVEALRSLPKGGLVLADEVGLGKTIEAGLVLGQLVAENKKRILVLAPASLRKQWANELWDKLGLKGTVVDGKTKDAIWDRPGEIVIASHPFAARRADAVRAIRWDCVVIDEAHRLRGAHRGSKTALAIRDALEDRPKLLLTATPLQNGLGELYGLISLLDRDVLGPFNEFHRAFCSSTGPDSVSTLRERVKPLVHRTLRRQVREYVRYTERISMLWKFSPTPAEQRLYDEVSEYLRDDDTLAIHPTRRSLMVMVYRKLLASSPQAIGATLDKLADGLEGRLDRGEYDAECDEDESELIRIVEEDTDLVFEEPTKERSPATPARMSGEMGRLRELAALAHSCRRPAKTEALLAALDRAFTEAISRGWPQKAVVFTESRRTQDALQATLLESNYRVAVLNGGSGGADQRAAIVENFRNEAQVLILTEAGAEGLNLQFANLVVNYDLPWNPQRVEQRIGRCHRYGQTRDVVVLNFLANDNAAETRLYELLEQKLELFDGVFGATDEPLGALADGAEFERSVFRIFQDSRSESDIKLAFDQFQAELSAKIQAGLAQARAQLLDHFDDEIRDRLKLTGKKTQQALDRDEAALVSLVQGSIEGASLDAQGNLLLPSGETLITSHRSATKDNSFLTVDHPVAAGLIEDLKQRSGSDIQYVLFDYTGGGHKISRLAPLLDSEGWWLVYKLGFDGPISEDHLVHVVLARTADGEDIILDDAQVKSLLVVDSRDVERRSRLRAATLASTHGEAALEPRIAALTKDARVRADEIQAQTRRSIDAMFEDRLRALTQQTSTVLERWRTARARNDEAGQRTFTEVKRALDRETEQRQRALERRKQRLTELESRAGLTVNRTLIGTSYFWLQ